MSVLESGFPFFSGSALPPKTLVNLLMNVVFPHPESAPSPMTSVFLASSATEAAAALEEQLRFQDERQQALPVFNTTCLWLIPKWGFDGFEVEKKKKKNWLIGLKVEILKAVFIIDEKQRKKQSRS